MREASGGRERELSSEIPEDRDGDLFSGELNLSNLSDLGDRSELEPVDKLPFDVGDLCANPAGPAPWPTGDLRGESDRGDNGSDDDEEGDESVWNKHDDPVFSRG